MLFSPHRRRTAAITVAALALALVLAACSSSSSTKSSSSTGGSTASSAPSLTGTLKIGVPIDLTGASVGSVGKEEKAGIDLAVKEATDEKFLGAVAIQTDVQDTQTDKGQGTTAVGKMISEDNVTGIVGFSFTTVALAGAPVAQDAGVPTVAVGVSAAEVTQVGNAIFRVFPLYPQMLNRVGPDLLKSLKPKTAAIILQKDSPASVPQHDAWKTMLQTSGANLAADVEVVSTDTDYSAQMAKVKAASPDVVFLTVAAGLEANVENQLRQAGYKGQVVGGLSHGSDAVLSVLGPNGKSDLWIDPYFAGATEANNAKFVQEFKAANGGKNPDLFNAVGYEGMKVMLTAVKQANSLDRKAVLAAMQTLTSYNGVFGSCTFDSQRNLTCPGNILKLQDVGNIVKVQ